MNEPDNASRISRFLIFATVVLVVVVCHYARAILIPLALALLLAFLLSPLVVRLARFGLHRTLAVIVTVALAISVFAGIGWVITVQALNLVQEIPRYEKTIEAKIHRLQQPNVSPALAQAAGIVEKIQKDLTVSESKSAANPSERTPVPVEVEPSGSSIFEMTRSALFSLLSPLATAGIVVVFLTAMLLQWEDLHNRFLRLTNTENFTLPARALDDAAQRVSRYLSMQLLVNATYGIPVGLGLYLIGIPNALLWGLLSTLLRFIPYLGPWVAASFPVALAVAIDPGWSKLAWTLGLYVVAEAITANIIEVWVYGVGTGISALGLLVAALFWTWLWGTAGLFLSTPLTVCLVVLGKYLPGLKVFNTLLGNDQPPPAKRARARHFAAGGGR
jgi:predicted PurR-regulated permease PerM